MSVPSNDNGREPIRVADWREAIELRPSGCRVDTDDGWMFTFGRKVIVPACLAAMLKD